MTKNIKSYSSNNFYPFIITFDILSKIAFLCSSLVLIYWLLSPLLAAMGIGIPSGISNFCEKPYGLANLVGYSHHGGFNFAGGIAALIFFVVGFVFEFVRNLFIRH